MGSQQVIKSPIHKVSVKKEIVSKNNFFGYFTGTFWVVLILFVKLEAFRVLVRKMTCNAQQESIVIFWGNFWGQSASSENT